MWADVLTFVTAIYVGAEFDSVGEVATMFDGQIGEAFSGIQTEF